MNSKWNYQPPTPERLQQAKELAEKLSTSPVMASLLIERGIRTESAAKRFLRPLLSELIDPFLMNDMDSRGRMIFLSAVLMVLEHMPRFCPLKVCIAHRTKETDMTDVLPARIEPSQIRAS